jgi:hypothetical protein
MPVFDVQTPDGRKFQVDAPDIQSASTALQSYAPKQQASPGMTTGLGRSFAEGVPILGGLVNKAEAATEAAAAPYVEPFLDTIGVKQPGERINAPTFGERYNKALNIQEGMDESFAKAHPVAETAAEIAGGVASTGALATTGLGAKALGLTAKTLPGMIGTGAVSGGVIGATDAAVRGEDPAVEGGVGAVAGAAGPAVGRAVGELAAPVVRTLRGLRDPEAEAARRVATTLSRDIKSGNSGLTPQEFVGGKNAGTPVALMDLGGETTRGLARSAANTSPEGRAILDKAIDSRFQTQGDRLTDWLNTTFNYPNAEAQQKAMDEVARTANRPAYAKAYAAGAGGLWNEGFEQISQAPVVQDAIRKAMVSAKNEAARSGFTPPKNPFTTDATGRLVLKADENGNRMLPNLQFWDIVKRNLDKVGTRESKDWSRVLRGHLDEQVPSYADARAGAAKFFGASDALEAGQAAVTSKMSNRDIRAGLAKMSPTEKQMFQDGFVDGYVKTIREMPDRRSVLNKIATSDAARERLSLALGPDKAKELEAMLRVEGIMDTARSAVKGNSTTARQLVELGLAGGVNLYEGGGSFTADPTALAKSMLIYGAARGNRAIDERVAQQVAKMLTSSDITDISKGIKLIARNKNMMAAIRNADAALGAIGTRATTPAIGGALGNRQQ